MESSTRVLPAREARAFGFLQERSCQSIAGDETAAYGAALTQSLPSLFAMSNSPRPRRVGAQSLDSAPGSFFVSEQSRLSCIHSCWGRGSCPLDRSSFRVEPMG